MKILFVCTGNICRSPLAEGILRKKCVENQISAETDSCGFESFHVGDPPDVRAQTVASKHGIDISGHRARLFTRRDLEVFDVIYVMDSTHYQQVMHLVSNESQKRKVDFILNVVHPAKNLPVDDPWYHDIKAFNRTFSELDNACDCIIHKLQTHQPLP